MTASEKEEMSKADSAPRPPGFWLEEIPLLTKVYQWTPSVDEVGLLFYSLPPSFHLINEAVENIRSHDEPPVLFPEMQRQPKQRQALADVIAVCKLVKTTMQTLYEYHGIAPDALAELNDWLASTEVVRLAYDSSVFHSTTGPFPVHTAGQEAAAVMHDVFDDWGALEHKRKVTLEKGLLPADGIVEETEQSTDISAAALIARELKRVVLYDCRMLRKCEECGAIYERNRIRPQQRFCSFRCSDRNGKRRRKKQRDKEVSR